MEKLEKEKLFVDFFDTDTFTGSPNIGKAMFHSIKIDHSISEKPSNET